MQGQRDSCADILVAIALWSNVGEKCLEKTYPNLKIGKLAAWPVMSLLSKTLGLPRLLVHHLRLVKVFYNPAGNSMQMTLLS
jgi:hypothetical protein